MYFHKENLYHGLYKLYLHYFSDTSSKLSKCTKLVSTVRALGEQILMIQNHHEGKTNHREINETVKRLKKITIGKK